MDTLKPAAIPLTKGDQVAKLQAEFYEFDFSPLMREGTQTGSLWATVLPIINTVLTVILLFRVFTMR